MHKLASIESRTSLPTSLKLGRYRTQYLEKVLVTPASIARGLDFKEVSHVYALGVLPATASEYVHMAGRVGRVGQTVDGVVTSVLGSAKEVLALQAIVEGDLARSLLVAETCAEAVEQERGEDDGTALSTFEVVEEEKADIRDNPPEAMAALIEANTLDDGTDGTGPPSAELQALYIGSNFVLGMLGTPNFKRLVPLSIKADFWK